MNPKPELEVVPPEEKKDTRAPNVFHDETLQQQLASFGRASGLIAKLAERLRVRNEINGQIAVLNNHTRLYEAGQRLISARTELERKRNEYLQLGIEHELKEREKESGVARNEADAAEHNLRRDIAEYKRQHLEQFIEGAQIVAQKDPEPKLSPEQQRRLKRMEIEDQLRELDRREAEALKTSRDEHDRKRIQNMYEDKRENLHEQLANYLV